MKPGHQDDHDRDLTEQDARHRDAMACRGARERRLAMFLPPADGHGDHDHGRKAAMPQNPNPDRALRPGGEQAGQGEHAGQDDQLPGRHGAAE
jgi:hypothetical protein